MAEKSLPATSANMQKAIDVIDSQQGGGGTELLPALKRALSLKKDESFSRTVVMVTDGYVRVEEDAFDLIRKNLSNANMFAFGIGSSVNRHLIEGMAHVGMGEPFIITKPEEACRQAERFRKMIQSPVLTQVEISFNGFNPYDVEPVSMPDVLAERPVLVFGKWRGKPQGFIQLSGVTGVGRYSETVTVSDYKPSKDNAALKYLWARHRITILSDYNKLRNDDQRSQEVTDLGLNYNLLTAYTSFVAVDHDVRNHDGKSSTVKQPLPLPEGVSDYAIGGQRNVALSPAVYKGWGMRREALSTLTEDKRSDEQTRVPREKDKEQRVSVVSVTVSAGLAKDEILKIVQADLNRIEKCLAGANDSGMATINLTIRADGTVKHVELTTGGIKDAKVKQCIVAAISTFQFSATPNGKDGRVTLILKIL